MTTERRARSSTGCWLHSAIAVLSRALVLPPEGIADVLEAAARSAEVPVSYGD